MKTSQAKIGERFRKNETVAIVKKIEETRVQVLLSDTGERTYIDALEFAATWRSLEIR